jgi:hypothetical protein
MKLEFEVPVKATNTLNARMHWAVKAKRVSAERRKVALLMPRHQLRPVLVVTLTRVGPRELDDDNLAGACKGVRDAVAAAMRIDDGSKLITWKYEQEKGDYAVRVRIEVAS